MALHQLAPDVLALILKAVDCPRDLYSLISASAACFRTFICSPKHILSSVLRNAILPEAIPHALAAISVPVAPADSAAPAPHQGVDAFLNDYFTGRPFDFPTTRSELFGSVAFIFESWPLS
jgi:hypothetical protein